MMANIETVRDMVNHIFIHNPTGHHILPVHIEASIGVSNPTVPCPFPTTSALFHVSPKPSLGPLCLEFKSRNHIPRHTGIKAKVFRIDAKGITAPSTDYRVGWNMADEILVCNPMGHSSSPIQIKLGATPAIRQSRPYPTTIFLVYAFPESVPGLFSAKYQVDGHSYFSKKIAPHGWPSESPNGGISAPGEAKLEDCNGTYNIQTFIPGVKR